MEDNGSVSEGTSSEGTITWKNREKAQIKIMEEGFHLRYRKDKEQPMVTNEIENAIEEAIKAESIYPEGMK
ncbi:hypothetical protein RhiirA4_478111 [Rhizophagus irregularis]|uniref:Uncharacterized protein n=1 Tax=Rhizophagus irregularis TaxID=588596 RepID=A0A2I1HE97_9GLOM|nr:hypothetical protein RhiirA4_478111 [Rhizophagus irregularis]